MKLFKKTAIAALATILSMQMLALAFEGENPTDNEPSPVGWYISHTGVVAEIEENEDDGLKKIALANSSGEIDAYFYISGDTLIIPPLSSNATDIEKGVEITYVPSNRPMIMIYPPQYSVDVATFAEEGCFQSRPFRQGPVSGDKTLKLNLGKIPKSMPQPTENSRRLITQKKSWQIKTTGKLRRFNTKHSGNHNAKEDCCPSRRKGARQIQTKTKRTFPKSCRRVPYAPIVVGEDNHKAECICHRQ